MLEPSRFVQNAIDVTAIQFRKEARITFVEVAMQGPARDDLTYTIMPGDWLVFFPNGDKRVVSNNDFQQQFSLPGEPNETS